MTDEEKEAIWAARHRTLIGIGTRVGEVAGKLFQKPWLSFGKCETTCVACFENVEQLKFDLKNLVEELDAELALWNPTPDSVVLKRQMVAIRASRAAMAETEGGQA